jgi:hypothetical protein
MTTFNPKLHPRGHVSHPGRFSDKENSAPENQLETPPVTYTHLLDTDLESWDASLDSNGSSYTTRNGVQLDRRTGL